MIPTFGVSEFTTYPWTFERDVETYARLGAQAIEVCEFKLDAKQEQNQWRTLAESGLKISSVQPRLHSLFPDEPRPEPKEPRERMRCFRRTIDRFAAAKPATVNDDPVTFVSITGAAPQGNYRHAYETAIEEYRALADYAGERGGRIALEPLNPILMNVDTFICTLSDAMEIVEAVDSPNFGVFVDVWHIWPDAKAAETIEACGEKIFGVHINDWHRPRHYGDRAIIGTGNIDLPPLLHAIHNAGYPGAYTLEIFSVDWLEDSLWKADMVEVIRRNKTAFATVWEQAMRTPL